MNVGVLIGVSPQHLILRAQEWDVHTALPQIGDIVYTAEKKLVGTIADIFGPVKKPFVSIRVHRAHHVTLAQFQDKQGQSFYTMPAKSKSTRPSDSGSAPRKFSKPSQSKAPRYSKSAPPHPEHPGANRSRDEHHYHKPKK